jgi:hypothetical protein
MKMTVKIIAFASAVLAAAALLIAAPAWAAAGNTGFGFNATGISGFPTGAARLTGGGAYNPETGFVKSLAASGAPATTTRSVLVGLVCDTESDDQVQGDDGPLGVFVPA